MLDLKKESPLDDYTNQKGVLIPSEYNGVEMKHNNNQSIQGSEINSVMFF